MVDDFYLLYNLRRNVHSTQEVGQAEGVIKPKEAKGLQYSTVYSAGKMSIVAVFIFMCACTCAVVEPTK